MKEGHNSELGLEPRSGQVQQCWSFFLGGKKEFDAERAVTRRA